MGRYKASTRKMDKSIMFMMMEVGALQMGFGTMAIDGSLKRSPGKYAVIGYGFLYGAVPATWECQNA